MKRALYLLLASSLSFSAFAQNNNDAKARDLYPKAMDLYNAKDYKATINKLNEIDKLLGKSNARTNYLRTKAAYAQNDYNMAQNSCKAYFESMPKHDKGYSEMSVIKESLMAYFQAQQKKRQEDAAAWEAQEADRKAREAAEEASRQAQMKAAAERRSAYQSELEAKDKREAEAYANAQKTGTKAAYQEFIYDYPYGKKVADAKREMNKKWPAPVRTLKNGKYGYTANGKFVVKPKYEYATDFSDGLARVGKEGKYGFVNESGEEVIPMTYTQASSFNYGVAAVKDQNGDAYFILPSGARLQDASYLDTKSFKEGLAACQDENYLYGFVNPKGQLVVQHKYNTVGWFNEGICAVGKNINGKTLYGYIDSKGNQLCDFIYEEAKDFQGGVARVKTNGKYGLVDIFGSPITCCDYDYISEFKADGYALAKRSNLEVYIDKEGQLWAKVSGKYVAVKF
ncbi:MAG: WG repeat-containing protein [Paludibacteraceae bacterium]|nr:WG repeat-containing protein [Paludibacteraceae bacterium]